MIGALWAQSRNGVFGAEGGLPWELPEDLLMFRALTLGTTVLMGRLTWDSLPRRPLPGRANIVLSGQRDLRLDGAVVISTTDELEPPTDLCWVIGGKGVLESMLPRVDVAVVTSVNGDFVGDVAAPALDGSLREVRRFPAEGWFTSRTGTEFAVSEWRRAAAPGLLPALTAYATQTWGADADGGIPEQTRVIS